MSAIRIYSRTVSDAMDFVSLLTHMNYVDKQVGFQPARPPVYKLQILEDLGGRSAQLLVQSLGRFKDRETQTAFLRRKFNKPFYFTAIAKGAKLTPSGSSHTAVLTFPSLTKKYDIDVWIGAESRSEFKEKFIKGVALLGVDTEECLGSVTPEFMMDRSLSVEDIEVGRSVRIDGLAFEVISAQEAADFKCLEIPARTPKERRASDDKAKSPTYDMASGSCRVRAYGTLDQLSQLKRDLADGFIASYRFDNSTPVMTATENCSRLSYYSLVRLRGIQKASSRTYGDEKKAYPFYFTARAQRETSGLTRTRSFGMSGYDIDIFCGAGNRREFIEDQIRHRALLDPSTGNCIGHVTPEFMMNHRIPLRLLGRPTIQIDERSYEIISGEEAADFKCLEIPDRLTGSHDKVSLRNLASTLRRSPKRRHTTCDRCGRTNLARTIPVRLRDGSTAYLGSSCARHARIRR